MKFYFQHFVRLCFYFWRKKLGARALVPPLAPAEGIGTGLNIVSRGVSGPTGLI